MDSVILDRISLAVATGSALITITRMLPLINSDPLMLVLAVMGSFLVPWFGMTLLARVLLSNSSEGSSSGQQALDAQEEETESQPSEDEVPVGSGSN
ncbi:MAG TPA: hypothetical protein VGN26_11030 [Armatimonadota bacterium]|jgi:hypothetical protein